MIDENQMLTFQIINDLNQDPILKSMIGYLIDNTILIEKMLNILTVLKNNPLVRKDIKLNLCMQIMNQLKMDPNHMMNSNQMMFPNQMMNPSQMMNSNQMLNESQPNESEYITVNFRQSGKDSDKTIPTTIQCNINEKVSDIIEKYRNETGDRDLTEKFVYMAKVLNPAITLREAGMENNSSVFVVVTKGLAGG